MSANTVVKLLHAFARPEHYVTDKSQQRQRFNEFVVENVEQLASIVVCAMMISSGFRLIGFNDSVGLPDDVVELSLPEPESHLKFHSFPLDLFKTCSGTNGCFVLRFRHTQSAMQFMLKCVSMGGDKLVVLARALEDEKILEMKIDMKQNFVVGEYPIDLHNVPLHALFNLILRLKDWHQEFQSQIAFQLVPQTSSSAPATTSRIVETVPHRRPSEISPPIIIPTILPARSDNQNPFSIGHRDLDPLAPLRPPSAGGGMLVGPEHPMFHMPRPFNPMYPPTAGPDLLPPGAVPPGARFDPISPFNGIARPPLRPGQMPPPNRPPPRSGEPDFDEMTPPGYNDMFM